MRLARRQPWDIWLFVGLAVAAAAVDFVGLGRPGRVVLGLPVILLGQGYVALAAMFDDGELDAGIRVMLVLALSLCIGVLGVLAMYALGIPIGQRSVATMELVVIVAFGAGAVYRRTRSRQGTPAWMRPSAIPVAPAIATAIIGLVIVAGLVILSRPIADSNVDGYVYVAAVRQAGGGIAVDVRNEQTATGTFTVRATGIGPRSVTNTLTLGPGRAWQGTLRIPGPRLQNVVVSLVGSIRGRSIERQLLLRG